MTAPEKTIAQLLGEAVLPLPLEQPLAPPAAPKPALTPFLPPPQFTPPSSPKHILGKCPTPQAFRRALSHFLRGKAGEDMRLAALQICRDLMIAQLAPPAPAKRGKKGLAPFPGGPSPT